MRFSSDVAPQGGQPPPHHHHVGHAHFWSGSNAAGFAFTSDSSGQTALFAQVGQERNGVFFS